MENTRLKPSGFGRRVGAYLIDSIIVVIAYILLSSFWGSKGLSEQMGINAQYSERNDYLTSSQLYIESDSSIGLVGVDSSSSSSSTDAVTAVYGKQYDAVWYAYTSFYPTNSHIDSVTANGESYTPSEYYTVKHFEVDILGLPDPDTVTDVTVESNLYGDSKYYKYALNDAGTAIDASKQPVLQTSFQTLADKGDNTTITALNAYFYAVDSSSNYSGLLVNAAQLLVGQSWYTNLTTQISYTTWAIQAICFLPAQVLVFLLIPLCFKNGQTLGKFAMGLVVVTQDGYSIKWWQRLCRPLIMTFIGGILVISPSTIINFAVWALLMLVDYIVMAAAKNGDNIALHDKIVHTVVVVSKTSVWFASPEAEEDYYSTHKVVDMDSGESLLSPEEAERIEKENSILDLSTIDKHRNEAKNMTSFDDFEKKSLGGEKNPEEIAHSNALSKLAKESGKTESPAKARAQTKVVSAVVTPTTEKKETPPDETGFTDEKKN
jgi:uncharacterized RDD family membrane protein YckC